MWSGNALSKKLGKMQRNDLITVKKNRFLLHRSPEDIC